MNVRDNENENSCFFNKKSMVGGELVALFDKLKKRLHTEGVENKGDISLVKILTPRESQLYHLLLEGFTLKESAEALSIKYSTANTHMTGVYKKLKVNSRAELIIKYREIGIASKAT